MRKQYRTAEVAKIIGVHPNTVRLYEECGFIATPHRLSNGYRVFTDLHIEQFRLARTALKVEVLQSGLRRQIIHIIKLSAECEFQKAMVATRDYIRRVQVERENAEEALVITKSLLCGIHGETETLPHTRKQAAEYLSVTMDTLRNWELNGLFSVKRRQNGYRVYTGEDLQMLKIIRSLRCANYSLAAILRMLGAASKNSEIDIRKVLDTPKKDEDIITACDKLLTSLGSAEANAEQMLGLLEAMENQFGG